MIQNDHLPAVLQVGEFVPHPRGNAIGCVPDGPKANLKYLVKPRPEFNLKLRGGGGVSERKTINIHKG